MSRAKIVKEEIVEGDASFFAVYVETENANQLFLSEGEDKLGTLAVAIPQQQKLVGPPLSSVLLGDRNMMIARVLAELLAQKTNKIGLVSVFTKSVSEQEAAPILRKLLEKTLKKEENKTEHG
ncbi:MAG: proteasome assembly chaperone 4 family protein [Candidatus Bathyarchaeota archaeon]